MCSDPYIHTNYVQKVYNKTALMKLMMGLAACGIKHAELVDNALVFSF